MNESYSELLAFAWCEKIWGGNAFSFCSRGWCISLFFYKMKFPEVTSYRTSGWTMTLLPEAEMYGSRSWPKWYFSVTV